ncbi:MAG: phosphoglucomutase/phosphomannomutase family protein [Saprospiraceae bacterium]
MMYTIKFGTDGWRAILAKDYTVENVRRVAAGTSRWLQSKKLKKVVIGYDCRFGGAMFQEEIASLLAQDGIECLIGNQFVSTPMVSYGVVNHKADLGIVITASHNPPSYNGYKLKSAYGGPTIPKEIAALEALIPAIAPLQETSYQELINLAKIRFVDLEAEYIQHIKNNFELEKINSSSLIAYDAMYGAGQNAMTKLFPEIKFFHCEYNPGFNNTPPEPIAKNLIEICQFIKTNPGKYIGIATDGDADRLAMFDDHGNLIDSHHILLLLLHYLAGYKKYTGKVVVSFSVTNKLKNLADYYGLECIVTKIGFKYIAEYMITEDVLVAGEESGGLAIKGHIPERDGIWIALTILQFMGETGKSINQLIEEIYNLVGSFSYDRLDLHLTEHQIELVKIKLQSEIQTWGTYKTQLSESLDGYKYYFENDAWLLIRTSGTEPVLRIYAQGNTADEVLEILNSARTVLHV